MALRVRVAGGFCAFALLFAFVMALPAARADEVADFYRGKQVGLVVGFGPGGGYDIYARLLARHIGKYIPGNPNVVVQNMPGAGSLRAANYIYTVAPKDGSTFGLFARDMALVALLGGDCNVQFDPRNSLGSARQSSYANDAYVLMLRKDAPVEIDRRRAPSRRPAMVLGRTAEGSTSDDIPMLLRELLGLHIKLIAGYRDSGVSVPRHRSERSRRAHGRPFVGALGACAMARRRTVICAYCCSSGAPPGCPIFPTCRQRANLLPMRARGR